MVLVSSYRNCWDYRWTVCLETPSHRGADRTHSYRDYPRRTGADHGCVGDRQRIQRRRFRVIFPRGDKPPDRLTAAQFAHRGGISGSDCFWSALAD